MSSTGLASICLSTGLASRGENGPSPSPPPPDFLPLGDVAPAAGVLEGDAARLVERPLRKRLNDSRNDFLKDLRREIGVSPAPERSRKINFYKTSLKI